MEVINLNFEVNPLTFRSILKEEEEWQFKSFFHTAETVENDIQSLNFAYIRLLNKPYENEVTLTGQKPPLKCCQYVET